MRERYLTLDGLTHHADEGRARRRLETLRQCVAIDVEGGDASMAVSDAHSLAAWLTALHNERLAGDACERPPATLLMAGPAAGKTTLLSQLMALSPPKMPSTALLLECHEFWPSIGTEPKSLALGPLGKAMVEAVSKQMRKFKKVTVVAHSLGAWVLYKVLASLQETKPALMRKLQRVVLISPVANQPRTWLGLGLLGPLGSGLLG